MQKLSPTLAALAVAALPAFAGNTTTTLALVDEAGFNEIEITFSPPPVLPEGMATTELTGALEVCLQIDPTTDEVSEMTILNGTVAGSSINLQEGNPNNPFEASYDLSIMNLGASLSTPNPPGVVDPATGEFDGAQHEFTVNQGTLEGSVYFPFVGTQAIDPPLDFSTMPVGGIGEGTTGTVMVTPTGTTATTKTYDVTVLIPISVMQPFEAPGPVGPITIDIAAEGTIKLAGPATVDLAAPDPFQDWAQNEGIPTATFEGDENGDGTPNGLQWALGLAAADPPFPHLLQPMGVAGPTVEFLLNLPNAGSAAEIAVLVSEDPESTPFTLLDSLLVSTGNPIPAGTSGAVTINLPNNGARLFLQLSVNSPAN